MLKKKTNAILFVGGISLKCIFKLGMSSYTTLPQTKKWLRYALAILDPSKKTSLRKKVHWFTARKKKKG